MSARAGICFEGERVYSREIKLRLTRAGVCCEGEQVYSREINWNTSGLGEIVGFGCILFVFACLRGDMLREIVGSIAGN